MSLLAEKNSIRNHYRHIRRQISIEQKLSFAQSIAQLFLKNILPQQKNIAVYLAHDGEIDLQCLIEKLWQTECAVFLPVIHPKSEKLCFVRYSASTVMKKNQYGIPEPENIDDSILTEDLDIVLLPLVAFDNNGMRLGMGKGYYDKTFSFCRYLHVKPMLVGVAYQCQHCETLPADEWDVPLDALLTEENLILLRESM